jgi:ABC-type nitrate/sulfonate/bicarbonate transport system substrate-binding protein
MHSLLRVLIACVALVSIEVSGPVSAQAPKKIMVGDVAPIAADWPHFVASEKRLYQREGVDPEVTYVGNVANTVQQMVGGSFDIAVSTFDTGLRAIANGADAVLIAGVVTKYPYSIMTPPHVSKASDLKGKQIILPFERDLLTLVWNKWLREHGMQPSDVDQVYAGATPNRFAALTSNVVQAALLGQPFDFRAEDQGYKKLLDIGAYAKDYGFLTLLARSKWLSDNPETARAYLRALSAAVDWIYDLANRDEAITILERGTKLDQASATRTYDYFVKELQPFSRKLAIPDTIISSTVKTLIEINDIKETSISGKKLTDASYTPK